MPPKGYKKKPIIIESDSDSDVDLANDLANKIIKPVNKILETNEIISFDNYTYTTSNSIKEFIPIVDEEITNCVNTKNLEKINKIKQKILNITGIINIEKTNLDEQICELLLKQEELCEYIKLLDNIHNFKLVETEKNILKSLEEEKKIEEIEEIKQIKQIKEIKQINQIKKFNSVNELINGIANEHQQAILCRISSDTEYAKVYLQNFTPNTDNKKKTLKGTINILGNYNKSKGIREAYEVKVFENDPKGSFWCSCADHKFNSSKKNIVCKHICFIVCKVLRILETYFFETKTLKSEHLLQLLDKFNINSDIWKDKKLARTTNKVTIQDFKIFPNQINDTCTFCYDEMTDADRAIACACPLCKHCFHEECMDVWMEGHEKCSYCFNGFWTYYKRIRAGEKEITLASNNL